MDLERGTIGPLPYAAFGTGDPVLVIAGLAPRTGVQGPGLTRATIVVLVERRRRFL